MCNASTGHVQGPSQRAPVFSQAIHLPTILSLCQYKAVHMQHLVSQSYSYHPSNYPVTSTVSIELPVEALYQYGFHIAKELMNSEPL